MRYAIISTCTLSALALAVALAPAAASAQTARASEGIVHESESRLRGGLLLGAHFANFDGSERQRLVAAAPDFDIEMRERLTVGGFLAVSIRPSWSLRIEALVTMKGARTSDTVPFSANDPRDPLCTSDPPDPGCTVTQFAAQYSLDHILRYLEVPIMAQYDIHYDGAIKPHLFAGPALRFLWATAIDGDGQIVDAMGLATGTLTASSNLDDVSETFDLGLVAGVGIEFPVRRGSLVLTARYEVGLLRAVDGEFTLLLDMEGQPSIPLSVRAAGSQFSAQPRLFVDGRLPLLIFHRFGRPEVGRVHRSRNSGAPMSDTSDNDNRIDSLSSYTLLGKSGLRVSPLCLGTMTFGTEWGWGSEEGTARQIFNRYLDAGGNFIDTADGYTNGKSEEMLGKFIKDAQCRDKVVLATKFTFNTEMGNPNAGGNGRKNIYRALEGSLRRLQTDYIDLYWLHAWDGMTPIEEVMATLDGLVRAGKIRYIGLSDTPAWYLTRAQSIAEFRGYERVCALQLEYSLAERNIEREHIVAALQFGMGVCPWSPLASGLLTGKYIKTDDGGSGEGRLEATKDSGNPVFNKFTDRNWAIVDVLLDVAKKIDRTPAQVAINWITKRPGVTSTIIGATKMTQLEDNLMALDFDIPAELSQKLDEVSRPESVFPYLFFRPEMQAMIAGGVPVRREPPWYRDE